MAPEQLCNDGVGDLSGEEPRVLIQSNFDTTGTCVGSELFSAAPDCRTWRCRAIQVNDVAYEITRRPRLFRYAALRKSKDPEYCDLEGLSEADGDEYDYDFQVALREAKLWCLEFDVDIQGDRKTLRISFEWPDVIPSFAAINQSSEVHPQGLLTFLGHMLYPISVRLNETKPSDGTLRTALGDWSPYLDDIRYVCFEQTPFGMLPEDRAEAERNAPVRASDVQSMGYEFGAVKLENLRLREALGQNILKVVGRADPEYIRMVLCVFAAGSVKKAAQKFGVPNSTFSEKLKQLAGKTDAHKAMYHMIELRQRNCGVKSIERFNERWDEHQGGRGGTDSIAGLLKGVVEGLQNMRPDNFNLLRDELAALCAPFL